MQDHGADSGFLSVTDMLKSTPVMEGGIRYVYIEASNEHLDYQNEVILAEALGNSADYYLKFGNIDIDHFTQIGAKLGIPNYSYYEIGRPEEVKVKDGKTFVKARIFTGEGPAAEQANAFWASITTLNPPQRWYPSVGGVVEEREEGIDPATKAKRVIVRKVRWTNIGFSKTPVNLNVPCVATVPFGVLAKSLMAGSASHFGIDLTKALEAGYGTDSASLSGGAALRKQSLYGKTINYWDFREGLAKNLRDNKVGANPGAEDLVGHAMASYGLSKADAAEYIERFMGDLRTGMKSKRSKT